MDHNKSKPLEKLVEPNQEIQLDFMGPILDNRGREKYVLACIDRFSKFPTVKVVNGPKCHEVLNFLRKYIELHGVPRNIRSDQGTAFTANNYFRFCANKNINIIYSPVDDHRGSGQVERFIRVLRERLTCIKHDPDQKFDLKENLRLIVYSARLTPNRNTQVAPYEAHFGRKANTPLRNISTKASANNLTYNKVINCLDKLQLGAGKSLLSEKQDQAGPSNDANSDDEIKLRRQRWTRPSTSRRVMLGSSFVMAWKE